MKLTDFTAAMERIAPREFALEYDNPGLLVEPDHGEISRVLVALDCTKAVAKEAAEWGADLVLTHHPLFFHLVQRMAYSDPATAGAPSSDSRCPRRPSPDPLPSTTRKERRHAHQTPGDRG